MDFVTKELDTIFCHQTPEGIELNLSLAGPLSRGIAWLIDAGIRGLIYIVLGILLAWAGGVGMGLILIGLFLIEWFYPVFFEVRSGMTPGKKAIGLRVVHDDGTPVTWSSALIRNLIRTIDLLPAFNMVGLVSMMCNNRFKRLGDLAAGTVVIYHGGRSVESSIPPCSAQPPPVVLKLQEQRLIVDFCERSASLSGERRAELASLVPSITGSHRPEERLLSYGNWFLKGNNSHEPD